MNSVYVAKITGSICPNCEITVNESWSGNAAHEPSTLIIDHVYLVEIESLTGPGELTAQFDVTCNGEVEDAGTITLVVDDGGGVETECPPGFEPLPDGTCVQVVF